MNYSAALLSIAARGKLRILASLSVLGLILLTSGCTSRGITVTSDPPGAELSINHRVIGRTPMRVGFTHYGTYHVELRKDKYQVLVKEETVNPPVYGYDPGAFVADNLLPARLNDEVYFHYILTPIEGAQKELKEGEKKADNTSAAPAVATADSKATSARDDLLARAERARAGITDGRNGTLHIDLGRDVPKSPGAEIAATSAAAIPGAKPADATPAVAADTLGPVRDIVAKQPEGLRLAPELGIATDDGSDAFLPPDKQKKKPADGRAPRTPKDEQLIYDQQSSADPAKKKPDAEQKPPAAQKGPGK